MAGPHNFRGDAQEVAQVDSLTLGGTYADGQVYSATINTKVVRYTGVSGDDNTAAAEGLLAALQEATAPKEHGEITWTLSGLVITATGPSDGTPFTLTSSATGTGTLVRAAVTTPSGPNWWIAANFDTGLLPANSEIANFSNTNVNLKWGLDQSAVTGCTLNVDSTYIGTMGLPARNSNGYYEYRTRKLKLGCTTVNIGLGQGQGSQQIRLDVGSGACACNVYRMSSSAEPGLSALMLSGSNAGNVLNIYKGSVGLAQESGDTTRWPTTNIGSSGQASTDVTLYAGSGCATIVDLLQQGGSVTAHCSVTNWTKVGGTSSNWGATTIAALIQDIPQGGGQAVHYNNSSGTITAGTFRGVGSYLDARQDDRARAVTTLVVTGGAGFLDPAKKVTWTTYTTDGASLKNSDIGAAPFNLVRS